MARPVPFDHKGRGVAERTDGATSVAIVSPSGYYAPQDSEEIPYVNDVAAVATRANDVDIMGLMLAEMRLTNRLLSNLLIQLGGFYAEDGLSVVA